MKFNSKVLVLGADGQLGTHLTEQLKLTSCQLISLKSYELDICQADQLRLCIESYQPDYIFNCAAYTQVELAETERSQAFLVNAEAVGVLADLATTHESTLIHVSTDYVFDGKNNKPYTPTSPTNPLNVYGESKLAGEQKIFASGGKHLIFRTAWLYNWQGNNFFQTMCKLMQSKEEISVVVDQVGTPTYLPDMVTLFVKIVVEKYQPAQTACYHFSNQGVASWFDFACKIKSSMGFSCAIRPVDSQAFPTKALRPTFSVLDKSLTEQIFEFNIADWQSGVERVCDALKASKQTKS